MTKPKIVLNVLVACEESQRVCSEFRRLGHNAFSCDLLECSGGHPEWHYNCDVLGVISDHGGPLQNGDRYYLPEGQWTHLLDGRILTGGKWITEIYDFLSLPLFVREGTILPLGNTDDKPDYDYTNCTLHLYQMADGDERMIRIAATDGTIADKIQVVMKNGHPEIRSEAGFHYDFQIH